MQFRHSNILAPLFADFKYPPAQTEVLILNTRDLAILERRAKYRDHSAAANLVPKIKLAGAGRSGVTIKTDGDEIGPNSADPSGFQAARAKSRRAICP